LKRNFQDAFTLGFRVGNLYQVVGSPLGTMSCDTFLLWHQRFAHCKTLPDVREMVIRMLEFKESMKVHVQDASKEIL